MTKYLVAVEHPVGFDEENIAVTNDVEGFGPGLLAAYPIQTVEAASPAGAAYCYAKRHGLTDILIVINLPSNGEEWWMCTNEAHKIDTKAETAWKPEKELPEASDRRPITLEVLPSVLKTCLYFAERLKELGKETDVAKWFELSEIDKERDNAYWVLGSILAELLEDAGLVPGSEEKRTSTTGAEKTIRTIEREYRVRDQEPRGC